MNLSSQSYQVGDSKGTSSSLSLQSLQNVSNQSNVSTNGNVSISHLSQGQIFEGTVTDIRHNQVTIQIDEQTVQARFQDMVNVCIGETLKFVVRENTGKQVTIAPYYEQINNPVDGTIYKALEAAGLPSSDKNIDIVNALLLNNLAVDKQTITSMLAASLRYPDMPIEQLIDMLKNDLPLTDSNIKMWNSLLGEKENLSANLNSVMDGIADTVSKAYERGEIDTAKQLLNATLLGSESDTKNHLSMEDTLKLIYSRDVQKLQELDPKDIIKTIIKQMETPQSSTALQSFFKSDSFNQVITKELTSQWGISPESLQSDKLQQVSTQTHEQLNIMAQVANQSPELANQLQLALQAASQSMTAAEQLNQQLRQANGGKYSFDLLYTQIPLKLKGQLKHSDLYVYRNKKNATNDSRNMSLLLHLDMEYLGDLDVMIKTQDYRIDACFTMSDREAYEIVRDHIPTLEENLKEKGYFFSASAKHSVKGEPRVQELFEEEMKSRVDMIGKRYSFDIRA